MVICSKIFGKINPLEASSGSKNKSKDIHLPSIDVNFGSNRILCVDLHLVLRNNLPLCSSGATLTLAHGRRYGLIGRNGTACHRQCLFSLIGNLSQVLVNPLS